MNIFFKTTSVFLLSLALFVAVPVFAAEIRLDAHKTEINSGEQFLVDIIIHSEESLNAVEGRLIFPADKLLVKDIRDGNSVINFWVEKPRIEVSGVILFSGITPGGFNGANNNIFSVVFEAKNTAESIGRASIILQDTKALQNDGLGSQTALLTRDTAVSIKPGDSNVPKEILIDKEPPEDFNPSIENDEKIFDGKYFLVFATQDKISGIANYKVREGEWGWFTVAESPYLLKHQSLDRKIFVKAIDKSGNERVATLPPQKSRAWYKNYSLPVILIIVAIAYLIWKILWKKRRK